jgi:hypothetical protein
VLTLQDPEQLPAAMAVLASMYLTKPLPELLSELTLTQQLQAALLADMWQAPNVSTAAVNSLSTAAKKPGAVLPMPAVEMLLGLPTWPDFVLPLLPHVANACLEGAGLRERLKPLLLSVLGDLEAVWADAGVQAALLELSLPVMEELLSFTELRVSCWSLAVSGVHKASCELHCIAAGSRGVDELPRDSLVHEGVQQS